MHDVDVKGKRISSSSPPRISVIIPAYQAAPYISEALESVFCQTLQDFEVVVINDGSPDTPQLETALGAYRDRIRYLKESNRGVSAARNLGIQHSCGELLAFLDSDDIWMPEYLEAQVQFLDQNPRAVAAIADVIHFGELAGNRNLQKMLGPNVNQLLNFERMLRREAGQLPSATVVRRAKAIEAGLFDEQLHRGEDVEFCIRLSFSGDIGYTKLALVKYRRHDSGVTSKQAAPRDINRNEAECLRRVGEKLPLTLAQRTLLDREIAALKAELAMMDAYEALLRQEFDQAAEKLVQANSYYRDRRIKLAVCGLAIFPRWTARYLQTHRKA